LRYAVRHGSSWSEARTIVAGRKFWRHPAEVPELLSLSDGTLLAHWVEKSDEASEVEFILVSSSRDGIHWSAPAIAHKDRSPQQHGLASIVESAPHEASILWLQALKGEDGPVSLMRTIVGADGKGDQRRTAGCRCVLLLPYLRGENRQRIIGAYRDHTSKDIRDIAVLRFENAEWSASKILNADKWEISACPVNAASAAAKDNRVAIAWYTEADDKPRVQLVSLRFERHSTKPSC
jgi:hypothetical protein